MIAKEIPRIKKLRADQQIDYYMLFTNRRLSGIAEKDITTYISKQCDIPVASICLCGVDELEQHLKDFPKAADKEKMHLYLMDAPLTVNSDLLAEIVEALARFKKDGGEVLLRDASPTMRVAYERKNTLNKMTEEYAEQWWRRFLKETNMISHFLAVPENRELMEKYQGVIDDFQFKIIAKRKDYQTFDDVLEYLIDLLFARDAVLRQCTHRPLTRAVLFYMYWHCDIGKGDDVSAEAKDAASD